MVFYYFFHDQARRGYVPWWCYVFKNSKKLHYSSSIMCAFDVVLDLRTFSTAYSRILIFSSRNRQKINVQLSYWAEQFYIVQLASKSITWLCKECPYTAPDKGYLTNHMNKWHNNVTKNCICEDCGYAAVDILSKSKLDGPHQWSA